MSPSKGAAAGLSAAGGVDTFHTPFIGEPVSSGVAELDALLDGGPLLGTCCLLTGPAGSGKSTLR